MQAISVLVTNRNPALFAAFRSTIVSISKKVCTEPITIQYREQTQGNRERFVFTNWYGAEHTLETRDIMRSYVALIVAEWIIRAMEPVLLTSLLKRKCAIRKLGTAEEVFPFLCLEQAAEERARVYKKVYEYLDENSYLDLEGFVRFRLPEYKKVLAELADAAIDDFVEEMQYMEFVQLLRHFISVQEAQSEVVHVAYGPNQQFKLYDQLERPIDVPQLDHMLQAAGQSPRDEDYVISALITLAPKRIVVHSLDRHQLLLQTLSSLYEDRLQHCTACAHCLNLHPALDVTEPFHI